jgi:hypothetical protein
MGSPRIDPRPSAPSQSRPDKVQVVERVEDGWLPMSVSSAGNLRLTWAEDPYPYDIEPDLIRQLKPPLNVHGVDPTHLQAAVVTAKNRYNASASPQSRQ